MTPKQLKDARVRLGLTQEELGQWVGRSGRNVRHWESGTVRIDPAAAKLIEAYLSGYRPDEASE